MINALFLAKTATDKIQSRANLGEAVVLLDNYVRLLFRSILFVCFCSAAMSDELLSTHSHACFPLSQLLLEYFFNKHVLSLSLCPIMEGDDDF